MTARTKEAGGGNPPATTTRQALSYRQPARVSTANFLEPAAEVLLLLEFPLAEIERMAFTCLLERRLRRLYEGAGRRGVESARSGQR